MYCRSSNILLTRFVKHGGGAAGDDGLPPELLAPRGRTQPGLQPQQPQQPPSWPQQAAEQQQTRRTPEELAKQYQDFMGEPI
jgi:hypothetical protein